jgi:chromosome segregation ATPase
VLAPAEAPAAPVTFTTVGPDGKTQTLQIPRTDADVQALRAHRDELSNQLSSVTSRRRELSQEIPSAPDGASRTGLESRLRLLDQRILQLETDIAATGRQLSMAPADLLEFTESRPAGADEQFSEGIATGAFGSLFFFGIIYAYRRFRRRRGAKGATTSANLLTDSAQRLERVENAVEAIALEIERVGEGQRFVTKLLSESPERQPVNRGTE